MLTPGSSSNIEQVPADDVGKLDVMRQMLWALGGIHAFQILKYRADRHEHPHCDGCLQSLPHGCRPAGFLQLNLAIWATSPSTSRIWSALAVQPSMSEPAALST